MPGLTALAVLELLGTGFIAGYLGGIIGTGGCVLMLPMLVFLLKYPIPEAIATTVFAVVWTATFGTMSHAKLGNIDYETSAIVLAAGAIGALLGSVIFALIMKHTGALQVILGAAFLYAAVRMIYEWIKKIPGSEADEIPGKPSSKAAIGFGIGILTGILGLGGGYALVPSFIYLLDAPVHLAVGTSMISMIPMATVSAAYKMAQGLTDLVGGTLLGLGTIAGVKLGAKTTQKIKPWTIKGIFGVVFLYISLKFILQGLGIKLL
ncbi:sulfite exporter TauE/SafE family protein [Methanopyrus kandleri]|uniref:Probable membrane transporter protein n=1 Tax=Methanopyrus kandleri (strain AV19 / DSM 6324 / JCM 9639 / NBRC 100938) TaxID=190192 RepID=Q8TZ00_METKA|nr:sulfite exporter TauE/SafE family protein [Methanopyrus kandleri]AAM01358.1 Predicted permease [Methanopyrus kandleri AV19]